MDEIAFIAGRPVTGDNFFGRKALLNIILSRLQTQQSSIVFGTRRIGKSSILWELERIIKAESAPWLILKLSGLYTGQSTDEFMRSIAEEIEERTKQLPKRMNSVTQKISLTVNQSIKENKPPETTVYRVCELLEQNKISVVLLLDEIDGALLQLKDDEASKRAAIYRQFASFGKPSMVCTSFVDPPSIQFWEHGSSWHNVFAAEPVGLFSDDEALEMLTVLSEKSGNKFTENECRFVMEIFGNFPFYLQSVGFELFAREGFRTVQGLNRKEAFIKVVPNVVHEVQDIHFTYLIKHLNGEEFSLMTKVAHNKTISESDEKIFWKLKRLGLLVGTIQNPQFPSLTLKEFMHSLPEKSMWEKVGKSPAWEKIQTLAYGVLNTAIIKAVETATTKYF